MTIIVTGCAGFIGSAFCKWLLANTNHTVVGIDDMSGGFMSNLPDDENFVFVRLNVNDDYLDNIFRIYKPDACYHMAAYAAEGRSNYIRSYIHRNNTVGTCNVINACVNHNCKLIFTSSIAVYSGEPPFDEEQSPNPIDEYGLSKWMSERSIQIAGQTQGLDWCIIRPRNVFGPHQNLFDPARNLFGIWCYQTLSKEPITIFGDGTNKRAFTYIDDILKPLYRSISVSRETINLGAATAYTINEAAAAFSAVTKPVGIKRLDPRHEVKEAWCNIEKSEKFLGYREFTTLEAGLTKMWNWAQSIPLQKKIAPPKLEISKTNHSSIT